ncbi:hypothetical protein HYN48_02850 [Flavobacterium magnum]|uniref:Uncharacterized protein n=1 Tax=Flavobacterium magnum TaxID=2162713 RepID=A0A2S0RC42_9FLAO|nr:hypothetical protein [Flavobacterium magnum]AWA29109.1 hypothetical protein HYN48_02850 [Flavobacterium magnum]
MMTRMVVSNYNATFLVWHFSDGEKDVQFVPMCHVNRPERFARIKTIVDSFRTKGYTVYYEGVSMSESIDSVQKDLALRKFRTIIGLVPNHYADPNNKSTQQFAVKGYVSQTDENVGVHKATDINADLPINVLVGLYEKEKGEIILSECDWKTRLDEKYHCRKTDSDAIETLVLQQRNEHLAGLVANAPQTKIVILYGARHERGFESYLQKHNPKWERVRDTHLIRW